MDCDAPPAWDELPADALGEIAGHLSDATDLVRFHAVCRPWRKAPPLHRAPSLLLPWLIARPPNESWPNLHIRSPFSKKSLHLPRVLDLRHRQLKCSDAANGRILAMGFLNHDPMAAVVNPLTGAATCFPLPLSDPERDVPECLDTIRFHLSTAMLRHNNETGTDRTVVPLTYPPLGHHKTVLLDMHRFRVAALCSSGVLAAGVTCAMAELPPTKFVWDRYVLESQGKLFCVDVRRPWRYPRHASPSVSVYTMEVGGDGKPRWVEWEHRSDTNNHICFFLGWESSFAIAAREFAGAEVTGSFAYYVDRIPQENILIKPIWGIYRYGFEDCTTTMLDKLPADFDIMSMWFVPRPSLPRSNNNN